MFYLKSILYSLIAITFASSCVSSKLLQEAEQARDSCYNTHARIITENEKLTVQNTELNSKLENRVQEIERIEKSQIDEHEELVNLRAEVNQLNSRYDELYNTHQSLINGSDAEARALLQRLQNTQNNLHSREDQLNMLSQKLENERKELQRLTSELEARNARLIELETALNQKEAAVAELRRKVSEALLGFEGQGLSIAIKNGKVYVSLDEQLLFGSGSTTVDAKGVSALKKLATVLAQNPDINITIEGHTDDVPISPGSALIDNWDLSVKRATAIIRILLDNSGIDPQRLTASGRGEHSPVDPAKTSAARQKNRRTEIILTPDLDEVFDILESN